MKFIYLYISIPVNIYMKIILIGFCFYIKMVSNNLCSNILDMSKGEELHNYVIFLKLLNLQQSTLIMCTERKDYM